MSSLTGPTGFTARVLLVLALLVVVLHSSTSTPERYFKWSGRTWGEISSAAKNSCIDDSTCTLEQRCGPWVQQYTEIYNAMVKGRMRRRYVVAVCDTAGLADAMSGFITAMMYAVLSGRILIIGNQQIKMQEAYWSPYVEWNPEAWELPYGPTANCNLWDTSGNMNLALASAKWKGPKAATAAAAGAAAVGERSGSTAAHVSVAQWMSWFTSLPGSKHGSKTVDDGGSKTRRDSYVQDINGCARLIWNGFSRGNLRAMMDDFDVVFWNYTHTASLLSFVHTNPVHIRDMQRMGMPHNYAYGCLFNYLFRPKPQVLDMFKSELAVLQGRISLEQYYRRHGRRPDSTGNAYHGPGDGLNGSIRTSGAWRQPFAQRRTHATAQQPGLHTPRAPLVIGIHVRADRDSVWVKGKGLDDTISGHRVDNWTTLDFPKHFRCAEQLDGWLTATLQAAALGDQNQDQQQDQDQQQGYQQGSRAPRIIWYVMSDSQHLRRDALERYGSHKVLVTLPSYDTAYTAAATERRSDGSSSGASFGRKARSSRLRIGHVAGAVDDTEAATAFLISTVGEHFAFGLTDFQIVGHTGFSRSAAWRAIREHHVFDTRRMNVTHPACGGIKITTSYY